MNIQSGDFVAHDVHQKPVVLEWQIINGQTDELDRKIKSLVDVLAPAYAQTELRFARQKPELVATDFMLKFLAPFFEGDKNVDWQLIEQKINEHLTQFLSTFDWKGRSHAQDENIFITAKDPETQEKLGVIQFFKSFDVGHGVIKAALYGVIPSASNRGIERLLMAAIFRIKPDIKRIFLHTRLTNQLLIEMYQSWGFTEFEGPLPGWVDFEYLADKVDYLQKSI